MRQDDQGFGAAFGQQLEVARGQVHRPHERTQDGALVAVAQEGGLDVGAQQVVDGEGVGLGDVFGVLVVVVNVVVVVAVAGVDEFEEVRDLVGVDDDVRVRGLGVGHAVDHGG